MKIVWRRSCKLLKCWINLLTYDWIYFSEKKKEDKNSNQCSCVGKSSSLVFYKNMQWQADIDWQSKSNFCFLISFQLMAGSKRIVQEQKLYKIIFFSSYFLQNPYLCSSVNRSCSGSGVVMLWAPDKQGYISAFVFFTNWFQRRRHNFLDSQKLRTKFVPGYFKRRVILSAVAMVKIPNLKKSKS